MAIISSGCFEEEKKEEKKTEPEYKAKIHFGMGGALPGFSNEMKNAGIEIARVWIDWSRTEPKKDDLYDWAHMDEIVQEANKTGIELLGYFYGTPRWAKKNPSSDYDICEINDMNDFREFAKDVAKRYDGSNLGLGEMKYIGILNEVTYPDFFEQDPIIDYGEWLINGYEGIKEGNPDAEVLNGAFFDPIDHEGTVLKNEAQFIDKMLQDYSQYYDIINFHSYSNDDKGITETTEYIKERIAHYGVSKPMWITETNTLFSSEDSDWENENARDVVKMYTRAFGEGVEKVFWYTFVGLPIPEEDPKNGIEPKEITLGWALKGSSKFNPRQAYDTYKLMTSKLSGFDSAEKISDTQYKFTFLDKDPVYVLWGKGDSLPSEIRGTVKVTDYLENEEIQDASDINLKDDPVFIEMSI